MTDNARRQLLIDEVDRHIQQKIENREPIHPDIIWARNQTIGWLVPLQLVRSAGE